MLDSEPTVLSPLAEQTLLAGWLAGLPVPLVIIWVPSWGWVVAANVPLGVNQSLAWSTTVIMKDRPRRPTPRTSPNKSCSGNA